MKKFFFTVDFEDWFHIPYLKKYGIERNEYDSYADKAIGFFEELSKQQIYITVFVVADIAQAHANILRKIVSLGHEVGCHGYNHSAINEMTKKEFEDETKRAKKVIEDIIEMPIIGYRAPYFSMTEDKLPILEELGFKYDSSYIDSNANEYYSGMKIDNYQKKESLIYDKNGFIEAEIPTIKYLCKRRPIGGGGFFRIYPYFFYKHLFKKFIKRNNNFIFFIHPFEIAGTLKFEGIKKMKIKDKMRFQLGRKKAIKKVRKLLSLVKKKDFVFSRMDSIIEVGE